MPVPSRCYPQDHVVQFYEDDDFLAEVVADYLMVGVETGEYLLILLTPAHQSAVLQRLEAAGLDTAAAIASGRLVTRNAEALLQAIMHDGMPDAALFESHILADIEALAPRPIRAYGELVNLLCAEGQHAAAVRLEAFWHAACQRLPLTLLCSYVIRHFEEAHEAFEAVCDHHSRVLPAEPFGRLAPPQQWREVSRLQRQTLALRREQAERVQAETTLGAVQALCNEMLLTMADQASHDALTGLPHRQHAEQHLAACIADPPGSSGRMAVLHIDIDQLKAINDALGMEAGDAFLHETAQRITHCLGSRAVVSRLGSDEMMAVLTDLARPEALWPILDRLLDVTSAPMVLKAQEVFTSCCIGVSLYPDHGHSVAALVRHASLARRQAQALGPRRYQLFSPALLDSHTTPLVLPAAVRQALPRGELALHYRPLIDAHGGQVVAVSVVPCWHSARFGDLAPAHWRRAAEAAGEIAAIGRWVLAKACRHACAWREAGIELGVVVSVSSAELLGDGFVERVAEVLDDSGLPSRMLALELGESELAAAPQQAEAILERLKALGVRLILDPLGNGQAFLGQFAGCPFDTLRLHERFIKGCLDNPRHQALIRSVILMAHELDMRVAAGGVAHRAQADYLRQQGCDLLEGPLWSRMDHREDLGRGA